MLHGRREGGRRRMRSLVRGVVLPGLLLAGACGDGGGPSEELKRQVLEHHAGLVHAGYEDALAGARELRDALSTLVASPSPETLDAARVAWLAAREPYGQTEAFRFYGGPIDGADGPEPLLNAWPLDEGYVDYVEGAPESGIIHDTDRYPVLDRDLLVSLNEAGAEENVSTGYHAIEFLLWGQDLSEDGPGERPYTDFVPGEGRQAERRGTYLLTVADLLVEHLEGLVAAWAPDVGENHRAAFLSAPADESLRNVLVGIGVLSRSELAGERIFTAWDNQDQEDEHSCFSDNTHRDIIQNARGIDNVYRGVYVRTDGTVLRGPGIVDLLDQVDPDFAADLTGRMERSMAAVEAIPVPFDRAIVDPASRPVVLEAVMALQEQGDQIAEAGTRLGLVINTALPE